MAPPTNRIPVWSSGGNWGGEESGAAKDTDSRGAGCSAGPPWVWRSTGYDLRENPLPVKLPLEEVMMGTSVDRCSGVQLIDEQVRGGSLELVEGRGERTGRVFARGEFGHASRPTANKRLYKHEVWESNIERLRPSLESRRVLGELDHPSDGRTALQRASHVVTDVRLEGDRIIGEAEILDTAKGRDLKAILAAKVPVGVSSRGFGSTKPTREGIEEVQPDYKLVTFDFVAEPADPTAYPEVTFESSQEQESAPMLFEGVAFEEEEVPDEAELARKFAQKVLADSETAGSDEDRLEALRKEFADEIVTRIAALRTEVEAQVRSELESDPAVSGARSALEQIQKALLPFSTPKEAQEVAEEQQAEIRVLRSQLEEAELRIESQDSVIEKLMRAAREAGYRYHLECLLHEEDTQDISRIRALVGDVLQYDSPDDLRAGVEEAQEKMRAIRLEEEQVYEQRAAEARVLQERNTALSEGLEKALQANRDLALQVYATDRLQTHPQGAKILRMLKRAGFHSQEQVDAVIEEFREPERDADDLEDVRARVRSRLHGGREHFDESAGRKRPTRNESQNYNGLGASLEDLKHLSGLRG